MPRAVATIPMTAQPAAEPVTYIVFADYINRCLLDRGEQWQYVARRSQGLLREAGMRSTLDWGMDLFWRYDALASKLGPNQHPVMREMFRQFWRIGHERGWLPPISREFPPYRDRRDDPDYRQLPPPPLEDVQGFLTHLSKRTKTLPGHRGYTLFVVAFVTDIRASKAVRLDVDAVDTAGGTIAVEGQFIAYDRDQLGRVLSPWLERLRRLGCRHLFPADNLAAEWSAHNNPSGAGHWLSLEAQEAGFEEIDFVALHRAHVAYVRREFSIPQVEFPPPLRPQGDDRPIATGPGAPFREFDNDEVTRIMAQLRRESATWQGLRDYAFSFLAACKGLSANELANLEPGEVHLDGPRAFLRIPKRPVILDGPELDILRRWHARPDRIETKYYFPNNSLTGRLGVRYSRNKSLPLYQLRRVAGVAGVAAAAFAGWITFKSLTRFYRRSKGHVVLGEAWHAVADPEPILDGPKQPRPCGPKSESSPRGSKRHDAPGALPDLATCDPPISAIGIDAEGRVFAFGIEKDVTPSELGVIRILLEAFPGGLSRREMDELYGGNGWRNALIRLRRDPDLRRAIAFPRDESSASDYRIVNA